MKILLNCCLILLLSISAVFGCWMPQARWLATVALKGCAVLSSQQRLAYEKERELALKETHKRMDDQRAKKEVILGRLVYGELSLQGASNELYNLTDKGDIENAVYSLELPGATDQEKFYRLVILWADYQAHVSCDAEGTRQMHQRLEQELRLLVSQQDEPARGN